MICHNTVGVTVTAEKNQMCFQFKVYMWNIHLIIAQLIISVSLRYCRWETAFCHIIAKLTGNDLDKGHYHYTCKFHEDISARDENKVIKIRYIFHSCWTLHTQYLYHHYLMRKSHWHRSLPEFQISWKIFHRLDCKQGHHMCQWLLEVIIQGTVKAIDGVLDMTHKCNLKSELWACRPGYPKYVQPKHELGLGTFCKWILWKLRP